MSVTARPVTGESDDLSPEASSDMEALIMTSFKIQLFLSIFAKGELRAVSKSLLTLFFGVAHASSWSQPQEAAPGEDSLPLRIRNWSGSSVLLIVHDELLLC